MADRTITITLEGNDEISVPTQVKLTNGQTVSWAVKDHSDAFWLVSFVDGDAFDIISDGLPEDLTLRPPPARNGQKAKAKKTGEFPYRLAFFVNDKVYAIFDCPTIIIR